MNVDSILASLEPEIIELRRHLHSIPERGFREFKTSAAVEEFLKKHGYDVRRATETGLVADLKGGASAQGQPRRTIAVRADLDALPVTEETGLPFASTHTGTMHACGHDVHSATVAGLAAVLAKCAKDLPGDVRFVWQPAEEGSAAMTAANIDPFKTASKTVRGAEQMMDAGAFDDVDVILGLHCWPELPVGTIGVDPKVAMAGNAAARIRVKGKGGHGATPHRTIDPVPVAASLILNLQTIASRRTNPATPFVLTIGTIHGGTAANVIPDNVEMAITLRCVEPGYLDEHVHPMMNAMVRGITEGAGASAEWVYTSGLPPVINDKGLVDKFVASAGKTLGSDKVAVLDEIAMTSEDFAYYSRKAPTLYVKVGVCGDDGCAPLHNAKFSPDEGSIPTAIRAMASFVRDLLAGV
jgi:amidohydrolase